MKEIYVSKNKYKEFIRITCTKKKSFNYFDIYWTMKNLCAILIKI